ncbi:MAG: lycopene cyclase domain-containing protein [Patescibacteria group bacterium]
MIEIPFRFAYITLTIPFLIIWLILFFVRKDTRKEQLRMSYIVAIIGPISELIYFKDYWFPQSVFPIFINKFPLMIEDILFGFAIGGIAAVIYEVIFRKQLSKFSVHSKYTIKSIYIVLTFALVLIGLIKFGVNSIYASAIAFFVSALILLILRHDLFVNAVGSGVGVMLVMFACYFFLFNILASNTEELLKQGWIIRNSILDMRIANIPLTEMVWGFTWGFLAGPWYEFANRKKNIELN